MSAIKEAERGKKPRPEGSAVAVFLLFFLALVNIERGQSALQSQGTKPEAGTSVALPNWKSIPLAAVLRQVAIAAGRTIIGPFDGRRLMSIQGEVRADMSPG